MAGLGRDRLLLVCLRLTFGGIWELLDRLKFSVGWERLLESVLLLLPMLSSIQLINSQREE